MNAIDNLACIVLLGSIQVSPLASSIHAMIHRPIHFILLLAVHLSTCSPSDADLGTIPAAAHLCVVSGVRRSVPVVNAEWRPHPGRAAPIFPSAPPCRRRLVVLYTVGTPNVPQAGGGLGDSRSDSRSYCSLIVRFILSPA